MIECVLFCDNWISNDFVFFLDNVLRHAVNGFASRLDCLLTLAIREYGQVAVRTCARRLIASENMQEYMCTASVRVDPMHYQSNALNTKLIINYLSPKCHQFCLVCLDICRYT